MEGISFNPISNVAKSVHSRQPSGLSREKVNFFGRTVSPFIRGTAQGVLDTIKKYASLLLCPFALLVPKSIKEKFSKQKNSLRPSPAGKNVSEVAQDKMPAVPLSPKVEHVTPEKVSEEVISISPQDKTPPRQEEVAAVDEEAAKPSEVILPLDTEEIKQQQDGIRDYGKRLEDRLEGKYRHPQKIFGWERAVFDKRVAECLEPFKDALEGKVEAVEDQKGLREAFEKLLRQEALIGDDDELPEHPETILSTVQSLWENVKRYAKEDFETYKRTKKEDSGKQIIAPYVDFETSLKRLCVYSTSTPILQKPVNMTLGKIINYEQLFAEITSHFEAIAADDGFGKMKGRLPDDVKSFIAALGVANVTDYCDPISEFIIYNSLRSMVGLYRDKTMAITPDDIKTIIIHDD
ncbi:MAG: hypothetical protein ACQEP8_06295 [Chlamydiota bacterium]